MLGTILVSVTILLNASETSGLRKKTLRNHGAIFTFELWGEATYQPQLVSRILEPSTINLQP